MPRRRIVVATSNAGKVRELEAMLSGLPVRLAVLSEVAGPGEILEPFATFRENAAYKARVAAERSGEWAVGEDSGLEVDALGGRPGAYSARFAGKGEPDARKIALLLDMMRDVPSGRRTARFRCAVALASPEGVLGQWDGVCEGRIAGAARGEGGFGYDPLFIPDGETRTMAELRLEEKNAISHRGRAVRRMATALGRLLRA